jgi:hypothetical protein
VSWLNDTEGDLGRRRDLGGRVELRGALMASAATQFTVVWAMLAGLIFKR